MVYHSHFRHRLKQPLDRVALTAMAILTFVIVLLVAVGDRTAPQVRAFSWQDKQIGADDNALIINFTRPMNEASVEENFVLEALISEDEREPIPGRFSWAGRRMAYTLNSPAPYGFEFELTLDSAFDRFSDNQTDQVPLKPFQGTFQTRDRAFIYLGTTGEEEGRLVLRNLTQREKRILTPETLVVNDYEPYPKGDRVLFSATDRVSQEQGLFNQQLYVVSTGIQVNPPEPALVNSSAISSPESPADIPAEGETKLVLDSDDYQNLKFDLSPDGQTIVVYRVNRQNPADFGLWVLRSGQEPEPLPTEPGGDFLITPDSQAIAYLQGEGMAIFSLDPADAQGEEVDETKPLDFLPQYGLVLNFARDGSAVATVQFNRDPVEPTRSLFLVTNRGEETELLETTGSILKAEFDPTGTFLYCLLTELLPGDVYAEQPYLSAINLKTQERTDLLVLPIQQDIQMDVAPDGLGILFDQIIAAQSPTDSSVLRSNDGRPIESGQLWFFPIVPGEDGNPLQTEPDVISDEGLRPQWLP
ncbi:MAG: hypothetical protein VKL39_06950 [Leptolyngbyaceae bacterium]|nr:hypothetical protein [Leptolyngbyaceae bacterium]